MSDKYQSLFENAFTSISRVFEAEATQPQSPAGEAQTATAEETEAPMPVVELTPTEEQILTALVQKIGPEQLIAKVTQLAQPAETTPAPTTKPATLTP